MNRSLFTRTGWQSQRDRDRWDKFWLLGLFLAALLLFGLNLDTPPLTRGEEETVAQIARTILRAENWEWGWLFPTQNGQFLTGYSPIAHGTVALFYRWGETNPAMTRAFGALLGAVSVPLLYALAREAFPTRLPAGFAALIYLSFWPVVRHGRLAMLDGPVLGLMLLAVWCALRCRRDGRWSWALGMGLGLLALVQPASGAVGAAMVLVFWAWDTPRLLRSRYVGAGVALGIAPALAWFLAGWLGWGNAGFGAAIAPKILSPSAVFGAAIASLPQLPFCWSGLQLARANRPWSWTKLLGVWCSFYLLFVPLIAAHFPISLMPLYPALAIAGGVALTEAYAPSEFRRYPCSWTRAAIATALGVTGFCSYLAGRWGADASTIVPFASIAFTLAVVAALLERQDRQFAVLLFWGLYISLLLLVASPDWTRDWKFWI
ncbi:phospholipid carrier-dependent glycosyltransferase [Oscillatoria sp. FACHB-1406]|uniref:ArnT family glycosyltransferase n=1 Tax=Oscillatoria sp. FACHB-1406 TaxID=2692846 RepID=UPI0016846F43|nr:phospholipid carrier-dependent glycosyltransferase [Oscillatoria sp. FACHB-1406]MBD2576680.1 glycosyltransferase family 39 protein [Oscillatoria sp. FACHB-1406]